MISALVLGTLGAIASYLVGSRVLGLSFEEILLCFAISNLAGFVSLILTMRTKRLGTVGTWIFLSTIYLCILLSMAPPMRSVRNLFWMLPFLVLSDGFAILLFGPVQDWFIRKRRYE